MLLNVEYPEPNQLLYANVNVANGWCVTDAESLRSIELHIDGRKECDAILAYPRLDVSARYPQAGNGSLLSGFRCEFDFDRLACGSHTFEFRARTTTRTATLCRSVHKASEVEPLLVSDVFVDIVGVCNLHCAMCPHGNLEGWKGSRRIGFMSPDLFERIIAHLSETGFLGEYVNLYNWGEPILHPDLDRILDACRRYGVKAILSTNLSVPERRLRPLVNQPVELLMVSISGFTQDTYARNHRGGDLRRVLENLRMLARHRDTIQAVLVKYLVFEHNRHEIGMAKAFAEDHGFEFGAYSGAIPSQESHALLDVSAAYARDAASHVDLLGVSRRATRSCPQETKIVIDHQGGLEHCSMAWNRPTGRSVLKADLSAYLIEKLNNQACRRCLESGYSHYRHFDVISPDLLELSTTTQEGPSPPVIPVTAARDRGRARGSSTSSR